MTFAYFSTSSSGGDAPLYALFTLFIVLGASAATLLAPPPKGDEPLLGDKDDAADHVPKPAFCAAALVEARATLALFTTRRALTLAPKFVMLVAANERASAAACALPPSRADAGRELCCDDDGDRGVPVFAPLPVGVGE